MDSQRFGTACAFPCSLDRKLQSLGFMEMYRFSVC